MTAGTHRCCVTGCPNPAAYDVMLYDFDPAEGAALFRQDESCPYICVEHAIENERRAEGGPARHAVVSYPYTNLERAPGIAVYRQLEPAYV